MEKAQLIRMRNVQLFEQDFLREGEDCDVRADAKR